MRLKPAEERSQGRDRASAMAQVPLVPGEQLRLGGAGGIHGGALDAAAKLGEIDGVQPGEPLAELARHGRGVGAGEPRWRGAREAVHDKVGPPEL